MKNKKIWVKIVTIIAIVGTSTIVVGSSAAAIVIAFRKDDKNEKPTLISKTKDILDMINKEQTRVNKLKSTQADVTLLSSHAVVKKNTIITNDIAKEFGIVLKTNAAFKYKYTSTTSSITISVNSKEEFNPFGVKVDPKVIPFSSVLVDTKMINDAILGLSDNSLDALKNIAKYNTFVTPERAFAELMKIKPFSMFSDLQKKIFTIDKIVVDTSTSEQVKISITGTTIPKIITITGYKKSLSQATITQQTALNAEQRRVNALSSSGNVLVTLSTAPTSQRSLFNPSVALKFGINFVPPTPAIFRYEYVSTINEIKITAFILNVITVQKVPSSSIPFTITLKEIDVDKSLLDSLGDIDGKGHEFPDQGPILMALKQINIPPVSQGVIRTYKFISFKNGVAKVEVTITSATSLLPSSVTSTLTITNLVAQPSPNTVTQSPPTTT